MIRYNKVNVKLSDSQLNKLKNAVKHQTGGTTLRMNIGMFNGKSLRHELFLTARQTNKLRNALENNM